MLGPILFLVYIDDLPDELSSQVRLFGNDTAVYLTIGGANDDKVLQNDLDRLSVWEDRWDMEFKPSKFQGVRVTSSRNIIIPPANCVCGRVYCFHVVRPSIHPSVRP